MTFEERIAQLNEWIADARHIVFFTGAGISTGSGIPDFRSEDGLYSEPAMAGGIPRDPEYMLSDRCLDQHPEDFFKYLYERMNYVDAVPNIAHYKIAALQGPDREVQVITQNIDGLHEAAGSDLIWNLHGSFADAECVECGREYDGDIVFGGTVPKCECGGIIRPCITLYGEALPYLDMTLAQWAAKEADLFIVVGSSLTVLPAAYMPAYYTGSHMVIINRDPTQYDNGSLIFREDIQEVFDKIKIPEVKE